MRYVAKLTLREFANVTYGYGDTKVQAIIDAADNLDARVPEGSLLTVYAESDDGSVTTVYAGPFNWEGE